MTLNTKTKVTSVSIDMWKVRSRQPTVHFIRYDEREKYKEVWRRYYRVTEASYRRVERIMTPGHVSSPKLRVLVRPWTFDLTAFYPAAVLVKKGKGT